MKRPIALGVALAALMVAGAAAQSISRQVVINRSGGDINLDANQDGWITRAEASAAYDRVFSDLDTNHDGKLDGADRQRIDGRDGALERHVFRSGHGDRQEIRVITGDMDDETRARIEREIDEAMSRADVEIERADREIERADREAERAEREAERAEAAEERAAERAERRTRHLRHGDDQREVIIIRTNGEDSGVWTFLEDDEGAAPEAPMPPAPPVGPFMLLIANSEEADLNGDGALSLEEFRNQHLRFFDASDANGDGRVRFEEPPVPPQPPAAPTPPEPPRHH